MTRRQTIPEQWLIIEQSLSQSWPALRNLPRGSGVLVLRALGPRDQARLRRLAKLRTLTLVRERRGSAARIHNIRELRYALLRRTPLILLSPIHQTLSHPGWKPLPTMRAATLAALADRRLIALGGMNPKRYSKVAQLGFIAWAGISAFRI